MTEAMKPKMRITGFDTGAGPEILRGTGTSDEIEMHTGINTRAGSPGAALPVSGLQP